MGEVLTSYIPSIGMNFQNILLNHVLRDTAFTGSSLWLALFKEYIYIDYNAYDYETPLPPELDPSFFCTKRTEISEDGYSRASCSGIWTISSGCAKNNEAIRFPTAQEDWEEIAFYALYNDETSGSILFWGMFSASFTLNNNNALVFPINGIEISLTDMYSEYLSEKLLDHYLNDNSYTPPGDTYLALYSVTPNRDESGGTELSGSVGYSRVEFTSACWTPAEYDARYPCMGGSTMNNGYAEFIDYATGDFGQINGIALWDHPSTGNMLFYGDLFPPVVIIEPDGFAFPPYSFKLSHNNEARSIAYGEEE